MKFILAQLILQFDNQLQNNNFSNNSEQNQPSHQSLERINLRSSVVEIALRFLGSPSHQYKGADHGNSPETGFDCSGFVQFVLITAGVVIPQYSLNDGLRREVRHANEFFDHFGIPIHFGRHKPGDLVFYSWRGTAPNHMGIVVDSDHYIHAAGKDDTSVIISDLYEAPIAIHPGTIYNRNPIGFKRIGAVFQTTGGRTWQQPTGIIT